MTEAVHRYNDNLILISDHLNNVVGTGLHGRQLALDANLQSSDSNITSGCIVGEHQPEWRSEKKFSYEDSVTGKNINSSEFVG